MITDQWDGFSSSYGREIFHIFVGLSKAKVQSPIDFWHAWPNSTEKSNWRFSFRIHSIRSRIYHGMRAHSVSWRRRWILIAIFPMGMSWWALWHWFSISCLSTWYIRGREIVLLLFGGRLSIPIGYCPCEEYFIMISSVNCDNLASIYLSTYSKPIFSTYPNNPAKKNLKSFSEIKIDYKLSVQ